MWTNKTNTYMENQEKNIRGQANVDFFLFLATSILVID